jgi:hypothetical protein
MVDWLKKFFGKSRELVLLEMLLYQGENIMATVDDLVSAVDVVKVEVAKIGPAVDALEAKITVALANSGISAEAQAKIDAAVADLQGIAAGVAAAVADAADGVDEAVVVEPPII